MELRQLEYFAAVARHGQFTRASRALSVAQPAVSQQIKRLEAELGLELLRRTTRHVELTDAGELLLDRANRALGEIEAARQELSEISGLLRGRSTQRSRPLRALVPGFDSQPAWPQGQTDGGRTVWEGVASSAAHAYHRNVCRRSLRLARCGECARLRR